MTRHTYSVLAVATRHPDLFSILTRPRAPEALQHLTDEQHRQRALFEASMRADRLKGPPTIFGDLT